MGYTIEGNANITNSPENHCYPSILMMRSLIIDFINNFGERLTIILAWLSSHRCINDQHLVCIYFGHVLSAYDEILCEPIDDIICITMLLLTSAVPYHIT